MTPTTASAKSIKQTIKTVTGIILNMRLQQSTIFICTFTMYELEL